MNSAVLNDRTTPRFRLGIHQVGWVVLWGVGTVWLGGLAVGMRPALAVVLACGFAAAVAGFRFPAVGMFGITTLALLNPLATRLIYQNELLRYNTLGYWLLVVMVFSAPVLLRLGDLQTRLLQAFSVCLALQCVISADPWRGVHAVLGVVSAFGLLVYYLRAPREPAVWFWWAVITGTMAAGAGAVLCEQKDALPYLNPNIWSQVPIGGIFVCCLGSFMTGRSLKGQSTLLLVALLNGVLIFLSGSRGAMAIGSIGLLYLWLNLPSTAGRLAIAAALIWTAPLVAVLSPEMNARALHKIERLFDSNRSARERTSGRSGLATGGWYIFLDHPLGSGTGSFTAEWDALGPREALADYGHFRHKAAHSGWVRTVAEAGLPGVLCLSAYVLMFPLTAARRGRYDRLRLGFLVAASLGVGFLWSELHAKVFWMLATCATALLLNEQTPATTARRPWGSDVDYRGVLNSRA